MPKGFVWCAIDVLDPVQLDELYNLLNGNYVEDEDNTFR
jgi:glycylpeptide N-tetradecanoyltransferase